MLKHPPVWRALFCLSLGFAALRIFLPAAASAQQKPGKEYVNKKEGFRLQLPPGWREGKKEEYIVAAFESQDMGLIFWVMHVPLAGRTHDAKVRLGKGFVSEEEIVLSGLPARKVIFNQGTADLPSRVWRIEIYGQTDLWGLILSAGALNEEERERIVAPGSPRYAQFQQILDAFEFLEPVLGRMKAAAAASSAGEKAPQ